MIIHGNALEVLPTLPAGSVHCVVTSPPYWGLRDYKIPPTVWGGDPGCKHEWGAGLTKRGGGGQPGDKTRWQHTGEGIKGHPTASAGSFCRCGAWLGCLGLEPTPALYVEHMVQVFREVRRVLRDDGTLWLNLGDTYHGGGGGNYGNGISVASQHGQHLTNVRNRMKIPGLKPKDLVGIPWRVAFALQADGWWLRSEIIWHKPNPMPGSQDDRPTTAHEQVFLFSKKARYFFDMEAVKEPAKCQNDHDSIESRKQRALSVTAGKTRPTAEKNGIRPAVRENRRDSSGDRVHGNLPGRDDGGRARNGPGQETRNLRSVWTITTQPSSEPHFAMFPEALVTPCIKAGTSEHGVCPACGAPWKRIVRTTYVKNRPSAGEDPRSRADDRLADARGKGGWQGNNLLRIDKTIGWRPTCDCGREDRVQATVLDPFGGMDTVGVVCEKLGRRHIAIELNPNYAERGNRRKDRAKNLFSGVV